MGRHNRDAASWKNLIIHRAKREREVDESYIKLHESCPCSCREELRKRLRNKIKNKRSGRVSKDEKNENLKNHVQMLKDKNIDINQYLTQMFPDHKQRKLNKKKIMKLLEE